MLYILPFDHRASFVRMFGFDYKNLKEEEQVAVMDHKHIVYEGFLRSLEIGIKREEAALLVDEEFGANIHKEAKLAGVTRILTTEKSETSELEFEYGNNFREHIDAIAPEYVKVLLRYNPEDDREKNARQTEKLRTLGQFSNERGYKFLVELLIEPKGIKQRGSTVRSIKELQKHGINPDVWKLEGTDDAEEMRGIVHQVKEGQKNNAGVVILGRGEEREKVEEWLRVGASVEGVIGLAVGRTIFNEPLLRYHQKEISRDECANTIAENFIYFVNVFEENKIK